MVRKLSLVVAFALALALPNAASAQIDSVLAGQTVSGDAIPCVAQPDGVRVCAGDDGGGTGPDTRLKSFDGAPLALYVILPPAPGSGSDGPYPTIVQSHGWAAKAGGPGDTQYGGPTADAWAKAGYAVLQLTARGFGDSCGTAASRLIDAVACLGGYLHLDDDRYEVRDIQNALGLLVDEGVADPARIGATGESYGGGVTLQLATLKDRVMLPDGTLQPWRSPAGAALSLRAAAPVIPWSDLVYALVPNGRTLDYQVTPPTADTGIVGVAKFSYVTGLYADGLVNGTYPLPLIDPSADLTTWYALITAGEPYTTPPDADLVTQIARYHSAYYLLDGRYGVPGEPPSPLLIANGFTDDLFPVDEAVRYYNLQQSLYPSDPISLLGFDGGHARGQNKSADKAYVSGRIRDFLEYHLSHTGPIPPLGATALTQTCGGPSGGPYVAASWAALHPGEVDYGSAAAQTVSSATGSVTAARAFDPIAGGGACATAPAADQGSGVASYRLAPATGSGYTLLGAPTVTAELTATGGFPYVAARLLDVDPAKGTETLVARGVYRLDPSAPDGLQTFQLHPAAWHFAAGHLAKLELLGQDAPYLRAVNGLFSVTVRNLVLRLPVHELPGSSPVIVSPSTPPGPISCGPASSRITRGSLRLSRTLLRLAGSAAGGSCPAAPAAVQHAASVAHVYVTVSRRAGRACRFLTAGGRLSAPRSCGRPISLAVRGTTRWSIRLPLRAGLPRGRYTATSTAFDAQRRPQGVSPGSRIVFTA